jgi:hypothetical protein
LKFGQVIIANEDAVPDLMYWQLARIVEASQLSDGDVENLRHLLRRA